MTLENMSRSLSHACGAFVSFLTNVTVFLTKQFSRLNYHASETHSVSNTRGKSMYSLIALLRTKFDNIFQFMSNEFFTYVSKRRKHVRSAFLGYPISYRVAIRYPAVESHMSAAGFNTVSDTFAYRKCVIFFLFSKRTFYTNVLIAEYHCVPEINKLEDSKGKTLL